MNTDIEREAREQQKKAGFLAQPQDLYACQHEHGCAAFLVDEVTGYFDGQPCDCGANSRWGDLASKRMRANEQEIVTLRARVEGLEGMVPRWVVADTGYPVKGTEFERLYSSGWRVVQMKDHCPYHSLTRLCLMAPPIPVPETKS